MAEKKTKKTIVLLDAHAIIHRAYHALPEFMSSGGEPTGALYGLSTMLMKIITDLKPDYIVACYDLPQKTFRHEAYDAYKAGRAKAEPALVEQLKNSRQIFEAFNIPIYDAPGFEADDVIGTIVGNLKDKKDIDVVIASGDMDTMQLVNKKKVQVYTLKKGINDTILYDEDKVFERFGFMPGLLPDYKGLRGDPSDNIIGIKGIGEKTATDLIVSFGTIENIYKKIKKDEGAFIKAGISPRLITLLRENEEEAEFSKTLARIRRDAPIKFEIPKKTFWQEADLKKIEQTFLRLEFRSLLARVKSFFSKEGSQSKTNQMGFVSMFENSSENNQPKADPKKLKEASVALWLLNSDLANITEEDVLHYGKTNNFHTAYEFIFKKLKEQNLETVYEEIEEPIIPIVKEMEDFGVLIDQNYFETLSREYHTELDKLTRKIYQMAGTQFNINSPKQLGEVLFGKMGMQSGKKKGVSGAPSTRVEILEELEEKNPIITEIMAYRELSKLLSTYVDVIPGRVALDGRLHAKFLQNGTTTGRFSSQDPNLQNLPIKTDLGRKIRGGFRAAPGHKLAAFDYSQIELRVAAMLSNDKNMTRIFREKKDIHAGVAASVFGVSIDQVTAEMRRAAKVINFGIIYGMGVSALRKSLGGTREEAQKFYDNYFRQFSGVRDYLEAMKKFAVMNGFSLTLFGRRRYFPNINSRIPFLRNMAERTATNSPIQGTAADIIKLAIRFVEEDLLRAGLEDKAHLVLQIHDELVYEIKEDAILEASSLIEAAMQGVMERSFLKYQTEIPLLVHFGSGQTLLDVK